MGVIKFIVTEFTLIFIKETTLNGVMVNSLLVITFSFIFLLFTTTKTSFAGLPRFINISNMYRNIINKPFPINTPQRYWLRGAGFGLFVFLFLFLFKPFRLDLYNTPQLLYTAAVYGCITGAVIFLGDLVFIKAIAPHINEDRWTLGRQVLWNMLLMVCIA